MGVEASTRISPVAGSSITTAPWSLPSPATAACCSRRSSDSRKPERGMGRRPELVHQAAQRIRSLQAEQLGVVGALQARRAEQAGRVPDDLADRLVAILPLRLAVGVARAAGEPGPVPVDDRTTQGPARRRDDHRVVRGRGQALRLHDLPPARAAGQDRERAVAIAIPVRMTLGPIGRPRRAVAVMRGPGEAGRTARGPPGVAAAARRPGPTARAATPRPARWRAARTRRTR